ncbi:hypothetical protein F4824DRAFT_507682 [Ustulina deusta]|nr:hypothetical protein F4824DRAFT_507682 [Ustulina deusta]
MRKDSNPLNIYGGSSQEPDQVIAPTPLTTSHMRQDQDARSRPDPRHEDHKQSGSNCEAKSQEERHIFSTRIHNSTPLMLKAPEIPHMTPKIRIDPPEREHQDTPVSVSKRREIFEHVQNHSDIAISANTTSSGHGNNAVQKTHSHKDQKQRETSTAQNTQLSHEEDSSPMSLRARPHQQEPSNNTFTSTTRRSEEHEHSESKSFVEQLSETEIAKPTPIAPPNHQCTWKEQYLALTAEIRQLKAELSTRASLKGSDILGSSYGQREDDIDLLEVTIILHFRDRDDIVINTDVVRDEPSN